MGLLKVRIEKNVTLSIIQVYAATSDNDDKEVERTLRDNKSYYNIVMGDCNSKVGSEKNISGVMGWY